MISQPHGPGGGAEPRLDRLRGLTLLLDAYTGHVGVATPLRVRGQSAEMATKRHS